MAKTKRQNHSETRHKDGRIKELEKQVRQLTRQLKYYQKREHILELPENTDIESEPVIVTEIKELCTRCRTGYYENEIEIRGNIYANCNSCGYPKRLK